MYSDSRTTFNSVIAVLLVLIIVSCNQGENSSNSTYEKGTYGYDVTFLKKHLSDVVELKNSEGAKVLVTGDYQGRVMTSTLKGDEGQSMGWINYELIESGEWLPQFNPTGGEERFWIGPEGGQYSFYFQKDTPFTFDQWQVPAFIDTLRYSRVSSTENEVVYTHTASLQNYAGFQFDLAVTRAIRLLTTSDLEEKINQTIPQSVSWVAYETNNTIKNIGKQPWTKETGLLSIWLLGMFNPSDETVAIIPFKNRPEAEKHMTTDYFGPIPDERLVQKDTVLLLKCDGRHRSKLGLSPGIAKPIAGSFDFKQNLLTLIIFQVDEMGDYVNSKWEIQDQPFRGDVVNAYNDGPLADGGQLGPFYELESSSSALSLTPGTQQNYKQVTCHFTGDFDALNQLSSTLLGISLEDARLQ